MKRITSEELHNFSPPAYLLWKKVTSGLQIIRVYGNEPRVLLPDFIDGIPVTALGSYCFSASAPKNHETDEIYLTDFTKGTITMPQKSVVIPTDLNGEPAICGAFLEAVYLPEALTTLHNAAFYNCRNLQLLSFGPAIHGIGSDEFTNCFRLYRLVLRGDDHKPSGLPLLLERIETDLQVLCLSDKREASMPVITSAYSFPEYYEWLDEVSPAHLFTRSIHGEGYRMRKCFVNGVLNYAEYDHCFTNAMATETVSVLCHIALNRLRFPSHLEERYRQKYHSYIESQLSHAIAEDIAERNLPELTYLCETFSPDQDQLTKAIDLSIEKDWQEGTAYLMEIKSALHSLSEKSFDFDLDW